MYTFSICTLLNCLQSREDAAPGRTEKGCCGPLHNGFVLATEWVQPCWTDENLFTLNMTASGGKQNYLFGVNEGLFPIPTLISNRVIKRLGFFSVFKRNNQSTDTVRSIPGRNCKYKRKIQELLISLSLSLITQIFWAATVILTSFEAQRVLITSSVEMWQIFNCGQFFAHRICLHPPCSLCVLTKSAFLAINWANSHADERDMRRIIYYVFLMDQFTFHKAAVSWNSILKRLDEAPSLGRMLIFIDGAACLGVPVKLGFLLLIC